MFRNCQKVCSPIIFNLSRPYYIGSMRILHTSDWHIGKKIYKQDRLDEDTRFLDWLLETIIDRVMNVLLVSGDVFDSSMPPAKGRW